MSMEHFSVTTEQIDSKSDSQSAASTLETRGERHFWKVSGDIINRKHHRECGYDSFILVVLFSVQAQGSVGSY